MKKGGRYSTSPFLTFRGLFISCSLPLSFLFSLECSLTVFHENVSCAQQQKLSDSNLLTNPPAASTLFGQRAFQMCIWMHDMGSGEKRNIFSSPLFLFLLFLFTSLLCWWTLKGFYGEKVNGENQKHSFLSLCTCVYGAVFY